MDEPAYEEASHPGRCGEVRRVLRLLGRAEALGRPRRDRFDKQDRDLPFLHAGRPLRLAAEDPADELLPVRLRLLHQPPFSNVQRARFSVQEVVDITIAFYNANYIEGLFLSSGIIRSPDYTMEQLILVAKTLGRVAAIVAIFI
jgi:hypothetical protein